MVKTCSSEDQKKFKHWLALVSYIVLSTLVAKVHTRIKNSPRYKQIL